MQTRIEVTNVSRFSAYLRADLNRAWRTRIARGNERDHPNPLII